MARQTLILGAGVCGLAAAHRLLERDPSRVVRLLEMEERPGGLARSLTVNGHVTDLGPHRIFTELPDVQEFLNDLVGEQLETVTRQSRMWLRGKFIEYPPKPAEIAAHLGIGTLAGAGMSWALGKVSKAAGRGDSGPESFASVMTDAFGPKLYDLLVGPYAEKVWKMSPAKLHADIARVRVSAGGLDQMIKKLVVGEKKGQITAVKKFFYIAGGVEKLVLKLRDGVVSRRGEVTLVRRVVDLEERADGGWRVTAINRQSGAEEQFEADEVISTIPLVESAAMLLKRRANVEAEASRAALRFIQNILVCVVVKRPQVTGSQWLYFPEEDTIFNRGYEPKNFHASMGGKDTSMIVLEVTCQDGDAVSQRSDSQLTLETLVGLERVGIVRREEVLTTLVHRIPMTYPVYDLEYRERLDVLWEYLRGFPRLLSAGRQGLFLHNNMDHSIHMGFRAAERLLEGADNPAEAFYSEVRRFQQFRIVD